MNDSPPILQVQQTENGTWHVAITWHDGGTDRNGTFETELEAKEWARLHLATWLEGKKARDELA
jgi:hypothetical protein